MIGLIHKSLDFLKIIRLFILLMERTNTFRKLEQAF